MGFAELITQCDEYERRITPDNFDKKSLEEALTNLKDFRKKQEENPFWDETLRLEALDVIDYFIGRIERLMKLEVINGSFVSFEC